MGTGPVATRRRPRRFAGGLAVWTAVGLVVRILSVLGRPHRVPAADAYFYTYAANLLVEGKGFINPFLYYWEHRSVASAQFPPGFIFVLAAASLVGFKSFFAHRIWCALLGAVAVPLWGVVGRKVAGERVGLIVALLMALYPNIWMSNETGLSETVIPSVVAAVLLMVYRYRERPSVRRALWMGLALGFAVLTRDELSMLGLLVVTPVVLLAAGRPWRWRLANLAVVAVVAVVVVGPWVGYNLSRFRDPVFVSTGLGPTLASTDCAQTWYGPLTGYWSWRCETQPPASPPGYDESQVSAAAKAYAMRYVHAHESRIPIVVLARLGRGFSVFHPFQEVRLDASEGRPLHWALVGLWMYYALVGLGVVGLVALRRDRALLLPLAGVALTVVIAMILSFGNIRYRTPAEGCLVVLAAAGLDYLLGRRADSAALRRARLGRGDDLGGGDRGGHVGRVRV